jgi:thioesterase domain-containing protein/acyl carrier protein
VHRGPASDTVAYHHRYAGSDIYLFYAYGNGKDDRALDDALAEDIAAMGGTIKKIMSRRRFSYMPHPAADAISAGFFDQLEERQGKRHTYYTGSVLGFELVECVAAHAQATVQRHFGGLRTTHRDGTATVVEDRSIDRSDAPSIEAWLAREIAAELDLKDPIPPDAELATYQIDSVTAAAILGSLSQWLGWSVPPYMIFDQPTIASIAALVAGAQPATPSAKALPNTGRLIALNSPETSPPIFLIGGLMGAPLYLRELAGALPMHQLVFALQAAGLDGKEPPFGSVKAAADAYLTAIRGARPRGPYRLAGHSFGGLVAYEIACRLRDRGEAVHLVLLDTLLFGEDEPSELPDESVALAELLIAIHVQQRPDIIPNAAAVAATPLNVMRHQVVSAIAGSRPFAGEVTLSRWLPTYRAHSVAMRDFRAEPARGLRWTLLKAEDGFPSAMMHPKRIRHACYDQPLLGWESLPVPPTVITVPGNHYTMVLGNNSIATARAMLQFFDD